MPSTFSAAFSPNYKPTLAAHRMWQIGVIGNGDSWPKIIPNTITAASDFKRLGIIPTFVLTAPSTGGGGSSTAGTYGIVLVYRSTQFQDGLTGDDIQSNRSNIVDVTLAANDQATLTKVTTTDTKVDKLDIYAAQKIGSVYGTFYRVVKDGANSAGTIIFSVVMSSGTTTGVGVTSGTADTTALVLADDNDFPQAQPILIEMNGRLVAIGGLAKTLTCTFTNGSGTVTTAETIYDGIEFWNLQRITDTSGGLNARGTYLARYATANTLTLVNADGTADTYDGSSGSGQTTVWTEPNRKYSKPLNPHAFPADNINNDYPSAALSAGKVPNTNRLLIMGKSWVIAEDYDQLPIQSGLNYVSTEYGCSSHFSIVSAHGRLYWLDFSNGKREICVSDGSTVQSISTKKIKSILAQITLDSNGDPWRTAFIQGAYYPNEDTIRWGLYLNNNTVANYVLELDLASGDLRNDPQFYAHRYLDIFTYGAIRGNIFVGQYGWTGGIARIGIDNIPNKFIDWVPSGTVSGTLDTSGQTTTVLTVTGATFQTASNGLAGIQVLIWQDSTAGTDATLVVSPTYYHCRISTNTATTFTVNYVETCNSVGEVTGVDVALPSAPSGSGWNYRMGVIQGIIGPKWFTSKDGKTPVQFDELAISHRGYDTQTDNRLRTQFHENFDNQPVASNYAEAIQQGQQVADTTLNGHTRSIPVMNPSVVAGFSIVDNSVDFLTYSLNVETITVEYNKQLDQGDLNQGG